MRHQGRSTATVQSRRLSYWTAGIPETANIAITIATRGILLTKSENSVVPWNVNGTWKGDVQYIDIEHFVQYNDIEHFVLCEYFLVKEGMSFDEVGQLRSEFDELVYVFMRA